MGGVGKRVKAGRGGMEDEWGGWGSGWGGGGGNVWEGREGVGGEVGMGEEGGGGGRKHGEGRKKRKKKKEKRSSKKREGRTSQRMWARVNLAYRVQETGAEGAVSVKSQVCNRNMGSYTPLNLGENGR